MTARERAVQILREHGEMSAQEFARQMWPNSPGWKKSSRRHDGISGAHGTGITMSAGAFLYRMQKAGLVSARSNGCQRIWRAV